MPRVDYDRIAHVYDRPGREKEVDPDLVALSRSRAGARIRVLDVACGTGLYVHTQRAEQPDAFMVGVDRFRRMLDVARTREPSAGWIQGDGAALPFADASFDYVVNQFAYHHIGRTPRFVAEVARVTAPRGELHVVNIDPWSMPDWIYYRYFPECRTIDEQDFVTADALEELLTRSGFPDTRVNRLRHTTRQNLREFLSECVERHGMSQLLAISDEAHARGIERIERDVARQGPDVLVTWQTAVVSIVAVRAHD